ncbi:TlpA family protein disulfide reductase [Solitalea sp. MAHUQ-68]|uniref:TlpA family protein disulfide reductase n=1 Tax=Solitalea agri TaxID=2953739 RepID=A0A9X2F549_9SPHI|nr:TlpA disulfide reductase family protein [Solitalea agri]MCO4294486.1 TlpA family protein disulfide reductase [Solitalea agri]
MKKLLLLICLIPLLSCAQQPKKTEILIKSADNKPISYDEMSYLLLTGDYKMENIKNEAGNFSEIRLLKTTSAEKEAALNSLITPNKFFKKGEPVPNIKFTTIDGKSLSFEQLKGKVIVVNFWFTTCAPCLKEIPELNELYEKYKQNDNVVFLAISTDKKETVEDFLAKRSFNYQHVAGMEQQLEDLEIGTFPTNLIISPEGKTVFIVGGYFPPIKSILEYWIDKNL